MSPFDVAARAVGNSGALSDAKEPLVIASDTRVLSPNLSNTLPLLQQSDVLEPIAKKGNTLI